MNKKLKLWELNRTSEADFKLQVKNPIVLVLDDIRSFSNIGSFFRTADAFCVETIYLCGITAVPPHREIHKTALGAENTVSWVYVESVLAAAQDLKNKGYTLVSIEQTENTLPLHQLNSKQIQNIALVFGNEVHGVSQAVVDLSDFVLEIPQFGTKHSLNVSVCAGIVLWEVVKCLDIRLQNV